MPDPPLDPTVPPRPPYPPTWRERAAAALDGSLSIGAGAAIRAAVAIAVVAAVGIAAYVLLRPPAPPPEISLPMAGSSGDPGSRTTTTASPGAAPAPGDEVVVHAAGAVARPGLYRLPEGSRVADLVDAAGGLTADADPDRINLAAPLEDGHRVYVPRVGEAQPPVVGDGPPGDGSADGGSGAPTASDPIDINVAGLDELDTLPGIGPATAQAIIRYREDHGPFRSVEQLLDVPGIGDAKLAQLRDLVYVDSTTT